MAKTKRQKRADARRYYRDNKDRWQRYATERRAKALVEKYGLTTEAFDAMLVGQSGLCAGCAQPLQPGPGDTAVDHCHRTNLIRGLLCRKCNLTLGLVADSPETLDLLADYLRKAR